MTLKTICMAASLSLLAGCATTSQLTSGSDYLTRYQPATLQSTSKIDQQVRDVASIEPDLIFPARIGLARIERGRLVSVPADEAGIWNEFTQDLGDIYGDFFPVSPLIAGMVSHRHNDPKTSPSVIDQIRLGSARQHLDYVLIYEVTNVSNKESNALRVADLTVLGLFVLPSRHFKIESSASAMLVDVRNGYPYGSATAFSQKSSAVTVAGASSRKSKLSEKARYRAVENLTLEVQTFMESLYDQTNTQ